MSEPEKMTVDFFIDWLADQYHDDEERHEAIRAMWPGHIGTYGDPNSVLRYAGVHWQEVIDMLPEDCWAEVAKAMWHVYDPHHVMHDFHPIEEVNE